MCLISINWIICTGAAADFQVATGTATAMVKRFGMSEKVRFIYLCIHIEHYLLVFSSYVYVF